jgi:hypothetical protein
LRAVDLAVVGEIAPLKPARSERRHYSFATKYCSLSALKRFHIFDNHVFWLLVQYRRRFKFASYKEAELFDYPTLTAVFKDVRFLQLDADLLAEPFQVVVTPVDVCVATTWRCVLLTAKEKTPPALTRREPRQGLGMLHGALSEIRDLPVAAATEGDPQCRVFAGGVARPRKLMRKPAASRGLLSLLCSKISGT